MAPKTENKALRLEKQAVIFEAACRVFREKGFHLARMADIAAQAGISYGLVYHYFGSKADLFDAVMQEWWTGLENLIGGLLESDIAAEDKLRAFAAYFFEQYEQREDLVHIYITELARSSGNLSPQRLSTFKRFLGLLEEVIAQGQAAGALRADLKPRYLTYILWGSVEAFLSTMVLENQPLQGERLKKRLTDAILTVFLEGARP